MSTRMSESVTRAAQEAVEALGDADQLGWECFPSIVPQQNGQPIMGWVVTLARPALVIGQQHFAMSMIPNPMPDPRIISEAVTGLAETLRVQHAQEVQQGLSAANGRGPTLGMPQGPSMPLRPPGGPSPN